VGLDKAQSFLLLHSTWKLDDLIDNRYNGYSFFVVLYAEDILLITQMVSLLQDLLLECERELSWL
jgi:hypothetical protein